MADPIKGPETTYTAGIPEDAKGLRAALISLIGKGMNQGSTPYSGPLGTQADSGQLAAMNMLMGMSGNGKYSLPGTYSMPGQPSLAGRGRIRVPSGGGGGGADVPGGRDSGGGTIPTPPFVPPASGINQRGLFQIISAMRGMR